MKEVVDVIELPKPDITAAIMYFLGLPLSKNVCGYTKEVGLG